MTIHPNMLPARTHDETARNLGYAKGLLADVLAAHDAPEDVREQFVAYAVARVRRETSEGGRLA